MIKLDSVILIEKFHRDSNTEGFRKKRKPSNDTRFLIATLLNSSDFQDTISFLREENNFPFKFPKFLDLESIIGLEKYYSTEYETLDGLMCEFGLWEGITRSVFLLLVFNAFPEIEVDQIPKLTYLKNNAEISQYLQIAEENNQRLTAIAIHTILSKKEFLKQAGQMYEEIMDGNKKYLPCSPVIHQRIKNFSETIKMYKKYQKGDSVKKISSDMSDRKDPDSIFTDEIWVRNKILKLKRIISKKSKNFISSQ